MDLPTHQGLILGTSSGGQSRSMHLSIFWRLVLTCLVIIVAMAGVNIYALVQLRQLTGLSTEMALSHYPAVDGAKHLQGSLFAQLNSEKKFWATKDPAFLANFSEEVEVFHTQVQRLRTQDTMPEGLAILQDLGRVFQDRRSQAQQALAQAQEGAKSASPEYERRRDVLMDRLEALIARYIEVHEARIGSGVTESHARAAKAESATEQLVLAALVFGIGLAAIASYSILYPLRRLQAHIKQIGQGHFGTPLKVSAPPELRDLVETVNWMGEKLQELDDMKAEFLAHVSHELRTPMASIQEGTHLLLDEIPGPLKPDQRTTLLIMAESSRRLIHLISTILDLSKMEAGMMEYRIVPTELRRIAEMSVKKVQLLADAKHVQVFVEHPDERLWVKADGPRIEQVLDNLLSNALKFSPEGSSVKIQVVPDAKNGTVEVAVSDSGPGIAPEDLPHLFERFYQGKNKPKHPIASSGLGLALAKKVVEAHQGRIWIESEPGKGTRVRFILRMTKPGGAS